MTKRPIDPQEMYDHFDYNDEVNCPPVHNTPDDEDIRMLEECYTWGDRRF